MIMVSHIRDSVFRFATTAIGIIRQFNFLLTLGIRGAILESMLDLFHS